jgi:hypothetical protein
MYEQIQQDANAAGALPKILIVADGYIGFEPELKLNDFTIVKLRDVLKRAFGDQNVSTAHRGDVKTKNADKYNFKFKDDELKGFDQIWLFAHGRGTGEPGEELERSEVEAIARFMNDGGGVFATGDHEQIGIYMCGEIPRVRSMRKWKRGDTPSQQGADRHDTLRLGDPLCGEPSYHHDNQGDAIPQELFPRLVKIGNAEGVHPILRRGRNRLIRWLPDHTHEGDCVEPADPNATYTIGDTRFDEYPKAVLPQVLADTLVIGGHTTVEGNDTYPPTTSSKTFGAICAYDGHAAGVGRVVTEATWHHFMNINIDELMEVPQYRETLEAYYRNIAIWLARPQQQGALVAAAFRAALQRYPLGETDIRGNLGDAQSDLQAALSLGGTVRECLGELEPFVMATILENAGDATALSIPPNPFFDPERVIDAAAGAALMGFVAAARTETAGDPVQAALDGAKATLAAFPNALGQFVQQALAKR